MVLGNLSRLLEGVDNPGRVLCRILLPGVDPEFS